MRNTICATLTAITLTLCTALAEYGSARRSAFRRMERDAHRRVAGTRRQR